jgi:predicted secreted protein
MIKISAKGTVLKVAITATPTTAVPGLQTIGLDLGDRDQIDVTTHDSTGTEEFVDSGLRKTPSIEGSLVYDPADTTQEILRAAHAAGTLVYFTLILPDAGNATWVMSGYVTRFKLPNLAVKAGLIADFALMAKVADSFTA